MNNAAKVNLKHQRHSSDITQASTRKSRTAAGNAALTDTSIKLPDCADHTAGFTGSWAFKYIQG
jgi:hypothetical protein